MLETVNISKTLPIPAGRVWSAIADIDGLERWFPVITACRVIGNGVGALRILTLEAGGEMQDRIELIDHERRRFQYQRIQSPFPVSRYLGTVEVCVTEDSACVVNWTVEIEVEEQHREALSTFIRQAISAGLDGLQRELQSVPKPELL